MCVCGVWGVGFYFWFVVVVSSSNCCFTMLSPQYFVRSRGFSILPVALRGTLSKIILYGLLYRGSFVQYCLISSSLQSMSGFISMMAADISPSRWSARPITATSFILS